ncbi:hypothetical protein TWF481_004165 [Arthrobotrys musiformis]|uniref:Uncharacterized protein n=1 Tax=Arthrobotrys musiformis TaxID=47236 RepID=A0AAV9WJ67_9PEZI
MSAKGWDILFLYFHDIVQWTNLGHFAFQFEDFLAVNTLIACHRYGNDPGDYPCWYSPEKDTGQECELAVLHGFIAVTKGSADPPIPPARVEGEIVRERELRCYLVGRMSKNDALALRLAEELNERVARLQVLLYDPELESGNRKPIPPCTAAGGLVDTWITRSRTAPKKDAEQLSLQPWTIEWSLDDIFSRLAYINFAQYGSMARNYYEFIIIDRNPGREFDLLDIVADALQKLNTDPPSSELFRQVIQKYVPADEREKYLKEGNFDPVPQPFPPNQYNSHRARVRCWNAVESFRTIIEAARRDRPLTIYPLESRFISNIATGLESDGVITRVSDYELPCALPIVIRGTDGYDDIYFYYKLPSEIERNIPNLKLLRRDLLEFSKAYKRDYPDAVFARGRINVHYCAWPLQMPPSFQGLNFQTPEGRIYRWKALPFDLPLASGHWQSIINSEINDKLPFACLVDTTLVVCAENRESVDANLEALFDIGKKFGWTFSIPSSSWTPDFRRLGLGTLWEGVQPALTEAVDGDAAEQSIPLEISKCRIS